MWTKTRTATGVSILVLVVLASVTAFVEKGICEEPRCVGECGDGEVPGDDATDGDRETETSPAGGSCWMYDANRELIENENEMINHRMMWLLTIQGLLFASFFLRRGVKETALNKDICEREIYTIYALGVFSAVSAGIILFFGLNAIKCIVESTPTAGQQYVIGLSHGPTPPWVHYLLPWNSLPVLFVVAWHLLVEVETSPISDASRAAGSGDAGPEDSPPSHTPPDGHSTAETTKGDGN